MICVQCPFNLLCYAGRLDSEGGGVTLCVKCGELTVLVENTSYRFKCERRPLIPEYVNAYRLKRADAHKTFPQRKYVPTLLVEDPGPGLIDKLSLSHCLRCTDNAAMKKIFGNIVALDELEKAKEEGGQHTFELAGSVSRKP